jgi:heme exporter protein C
MNRFESLTRTACLGATLGVLVLIAASGGMIFLVAPQEATMGEVQRIVYLHVSVAWCGLAGCIGMGATGAAHLATRKEAWDHWSQSLGELGWLCTTLTLMTGSLWAHEAWNTWWTWEPRLTASLILWIVFAGYFLVRASIEDGERRARISSVLAILALADVPLVIMATRWFRGIHPISPEMDARMRWALLVTVVSFSAFFTLLALVRCRQLNLKARIVGLELRAETST